MASFSDWLRDFKRHLARHNLKTSRSEIRIFDLRKFQTYYEANVKDAKNQIHLHFDGPNGEDRSIRQVFTIRALRTGRDGISLENCESSGYHETFAASYLALQDILAKDLIAREKGTSFLDTRASRVH